MRRSAITALSVILATAGCAAPPEEAVTLLVTVTVARVQKRDLETQVTAPAVIHPLEQADIATPLTARIRRLEVRTGDRVSAGQVLARLEDEDLVAQRSEAEAVVADAEAMLAKVTETQPSRVEQARGQVAATRAAFEQAQANYDRRRGLFDEGAIPERDLIASRTDLAVARAAADAAVADLALREGEAGARDIEIARSRRMQATSRLAAIETQLSFATVRAPFVGTVIEQFRFPGDMAAPDAPLFTVANLSTAVARAQVQESDARDVAVGVACVLRVADRPEVSYTGRVTVVNAAVDPAKRTVEVWCEIPNEDDGLRARTFGTLRIATGTVPDALVVPAAAVQFDEAGHGIVMIADEDRRAQTRAVETGLSVDGWVSIRSGVVLGELVIVEGGYALPDGAGIEWARDPE